MTNDLPMVLQMVRDRGHRVFTSGEYNLNIVGVRSAHNGTNRFDDELHVVYRDHRGQWVDLSFECTTDPGLYYLQNPMNVKGTAILKPGQYRGSHKIGLHRGQYTALVQVAPVTVYRDRNRDSVMQLDPDSEASGVYGINVHHAGSTERDAVNRWSAGCTVISNLAEWEIFLSVVRRSAERYGDRFTYTLIDSACSGCGESLCENKQGETNA